MALEEYPKIGSKSFNLFGYANLLKSMHSPVVPETEQINLGLYINGKPIS